MPLRLGAGSGEWVAAQARADGSNWVALELMRDRAHAILRRAALQELRNVCVLGGEAIELLRLPRGHRKLLELRLMPDGCVQQVFVNFPEPPFVSGNEAAEPRSQGLDLGPLGQVQLSHAHLTALP